MNQIIKSRLLELKKIIMYLSYTSFSLGNGFMKMYKMYEHKTFVQTKCFRWIMKVYSKIPLKSCPCFYVKVTEFMRHYEDTKTTITMLKLFQTTGYYDVLYH